MSIAVNVEARIQSVSVSDDSITAHFADGRTISVPLAWSWRLSEANSEQRSAADPEYAGLSSTKTSAPREFSTAFPPDARCIPVAFSSLFSLDYIQQYSYYPTTKYTHRHLYNTDCTY